MLDVIITVTSGPTRRHRRAEMRRQRGRQ